MENIKGFMKKVKIPDAIQGALQGSSDKGGNLKAITKDLEDKRNEQAKIFGFIGMEVYDLSKEKKIEIAQIKNYIDKMNTLNQEIKALEEQKSELEVKNAGKNICTCGYKLKPQDHFCPNCGEVISRAVTVCVCGAKLKKNAKFCNVCGKNIEDIQKETDKEQNLERSMKECICGAKVPEGQFMCFECGRKIE